jgi:hypothetical protein
MMESEAQQQMRRRRFLQTTAMGAASWLAHRALADSTVPGERSKPELRVERGHLAQAHDRALKARRPLLVIAIPASHADKLARGYALGNFIDAGSDDQLSPFAYAELVCAPMDEVRVVAPVTGEPLFVLLAENAPPKLTPADYPQRGTRRTAAIADRLASLIAPQVHLDMNGDGHRIALALRQRAPTGSHWARQASCGGVFTEWSPPGMDACDMVVPQDRFLWFYARPSRAR